MTGVLTWFLHRVTGLFIFVGFIIHYYTVHYLVDVRLSTPLWISFDILFLLALIYHAFNGLWSISIEYIRPARLLLLTRILLLTAAAIVCLIGVRIVALA